MAGITGILKEIRVGDTFTRVFTREEYFTLSATLSKLNGSARAMVDGEPTTFVMRSKSAIKDGIRIYKVDITRYAGVLPRKGRHYLPPERVNPLFAD